MLEGTDPKTKKESPKWWNRYCRLLPKNTRMTLRVFLGGFSQGACMSLLMCITLEDLCISGIMMLSGKMVLPDELIEVWAARMISILLPTLIIGYHPKDKEYTSVHCSRNGWRRAHPWHEYGVCGDFERCKTLYYRERECGQGDIISSLPRIGTFGWPVTGGQWFEGLVEEEHSGGSDHPVLHIIVMKAASVIGVGE